MAQIKAVCRKCIKGKRLNKWKNYCDDHMLTMEGLQKVYKQTPHARNLIDYLKTLAEDKLIDCLLKIIGPTSFVKKQHQKIVLEYFVVFLGKKTKPKERQKRQPLYSCAETTEESSENTNK